jgi:hypothetical protein
MLSRRENFGLSVVEVTACSVSVLRSTQTNLTEATQAVRAGWVVPLEQAALREVLAQALMDDECRRRG